VWPSAEELGLQRYGLGRCRPPSGPGRAVRLRSPTLSTGSGWQI